MAEATRDGTLQIVTVELLGTALTVAAAVSDTTLVVDWAVDFSEDGGLLRLNGVEYTYDEVDKDADTIHLTSPVTVAAEAGAPVEAMASTGKQAQRWVAQVESGDADAETIPAYIPAGPSSEFVEGEGQAGMTVRYVAEAGGTFRALSLVDNDSTLDGAAVWNPNSSRTMTGAAITHATWTKINGWTPTTADGITISAGDHIAEYPGPYFIAVQVGFNFNATGRRGVRIIHTPIDTGVPVTIALFAADTDTTGIAYAQTFTQQVLAVGDIVHMEAYQSSGAGLTMQTGVLTKFLMYRVSI